jgi:hypothetical protein
VRNDGARLGKTRETQEQEKRETETQDATHEDFLSLGIGKRDEREGVEFPDFGPCPGRRSVIPVFHCHKPGKPESDEKGIPAGKGNGRLRTGKTVPVPYPGFSARFRPIKIWMDNQRAGGVLRTAIAQAGAEGIDRFEFHGFADGEARDFVILFLIRSSLRNIIRAPCLFPHTKLRRTREMSSVISVIHAPSQKFAPAVAGVVLLYEDGNVKDVKRLDMPPDANSTLEVKSSQVKSSQVKSSQVKSSQVKSSQVKSSQVKSSQVKSSQGKS